MSAGEDRPPVRILALDLGDRRTGVASTDWTGSLRLPLPNIVAETDDDRIAAVAGLCRERDTELVVVGLPLAPDGGLGKRGARTMRFVEALRHRLRIPVATEDETATTDEAHERLKSAGMRAAQRRQMADAVSALVILERFLDRFGPKLPPIPPSEEP